MNEAAATNLKPAQPTIFPNVYPSALLICQAEEQKPPKPNIQQTKFNWKEALTKKRGK